MHITMSEPGPPSSEAKADYIVERIADPAALVSHLAKETGISRGVAVALEKRLTKTDLTNIRPLTVADVEKRVTKRLEILDRTLTDEVLEAKILKSGLKDLGIYEGIFLDKLLTIKGQPTAILRHEDSLRVDQLGEAIIKEIKQRGLSARLTQQSAEVTVGPPPAPADTSQPTE